MWNSYAAHGYNLIANKEKSFVFKTYDFLDYYQGLYK